MRIYNAKNDLLFQSDTVRNAPADLRVDVKLPATKDVSQPVAEFVVRGRVTGADGEPIAGATVLAVDMDLRSSEDLGQATTDSQGEYEIGYSADRFTRAEKESADLAVRALLGDRRLAESKTLFNAPREVRIDLSSARGSGPSEYERLLADLERPLADVPLAELNEEDVAFLAGETGHDTGGIALLARAHRMALPELPAEAFFAWLRQGLPAEIDALSRLSIETLAASLTRAVEANTVTAAVGERRETYARLLSELRIRAIVESAAPDGLGPRDPWLGTIRSAIGGDRFERFATVFADHGDDPDALATRLADGGFKPKDIARTLHVFTLKAISHDHAPLLEAITNAAASNPRLLDPQALVGLDTTHWRALLDTPISSGAPVGVPPGMPGETVDDQLANYAKVLAAEVEARMPTARFQELARRDLGNRDRTLSPERRRDWVQFLAVNPEFDLRASKLQEFLADPVTRDRRLEGVGDPATLVRDMETIQRVFRLVPEPRSVGADRAGGLPLTDRYDSVATLIDDGFHSAVAVLTVPEGTFVERFGKRFGDREVATHVYKRAAYVGDAAVLALMSARSLTDDTSPAFASAADYSTLFGRSDLCECEHCRSFLGPAAYLVDTLQFLREAAPGLDPERLWRALSARRPDLQRIALSCANANTALPYVDLVNEILEEAVVASTFTPFTLSPTMGFDPIADLDARTVTAGIRAAFASSNGIALSSTAVIDLITLTADGLRGKRWFITDRGTLYSVDSDENTPFALVRWASRQTSGTTEELVAAPEHVRAPAYDRLAQSVYPWSLPLDLGWEETRGLLDQGGLTRLDALLVFAEVGDTPVAPVDALESIPAVCEILGMSMAEANIIRLPDPKPERFWNVAIGTPSWHQPLAQVAALLERSGLHYAELLELLETRFLNPVAGVGRKLSIVSTDPAAPATCDLTKLAIDGLDVTTLDRLHRFVRLWRRLGWASWELDVVLRALGATDITEEVLVTIGYVERLRRELELPLDVIAAFFASIDTVRYLRVEDEGPRRFPSLYDRLFRATVGGARINVAFVEYPAPPAPVGLTGSVSDHETTIRGALVLDRESLIALIGALPNADLTLANLSSLLRHAALARSLDLLPRDLLRLARLLGIAPFGVQTTAKARARSVWQLVTAVARVRATGLALDELEHLLAANPEIDDRLGRSVADGQRVLGELRTRMLEVTETAGVTAQELLAARRERLARALGSATGLGGPVIDVMAPVWTSLLTSLTAERAPAPLPGLDVLARLDKLARLIRFTGLADAEAAWVCGHATALGMPDLAALPISTRAPPVPWTAFERLLDYLEARPAARKPGTPLYAVLAQTLNSTGSFKKVVQALADTTGWSADDILWSLSAAADTVIADEVPVVMRDPSTYARLARALGLARRLGAAAAIIKTIVTDANLAAAETLGRLVRARRDPAAWLTLAGPLNNRLRTLRRDALVAYLLHKRPQGIPETVRTPADLYTHLLVDVEMSPCMRTSRIKLAVSSVQLFIQRCLMGLEDDAQLATEKAHEWTEWRSAYRIWEANRKVFLYPENWVEPELRETRSPFFRELESELGQAELTAESAERIIQGYLVKLEAVSNLDPVAIHRETRDDGEIEILHLMARTTSLPHVHYYRRRTRLRSSSPGTWSPWERVEIEVDSEHVILLVFKGRVRLYWAAIREMSSDPSIPGAPLKWVITLFWSEYDGRHWSRRQELKVDYPVSILSVKGKSPSEGLAFRARVFDNGLRIDGHWWTPGAPLPRPKAPMNELVDVPIPGDARRMVSGWVVDNLDVPIPGSTVTVKWKGVKVGPSASGHPVSIYRKKILQLPTGHYSFEIPAGEVEANDATLESVQASHSSVESLKKSIPAIGAHRRSFKFPDVTLPATQFTAAQWPPVFSIMIDRSGRGALASPLMNALVAPPGCRVTGTGYRGETPGATIFGRQDLPLRLPFKLVPIACLGENESDAQVYAYRNEESFALLEQRQPLAPTILGPTLAPMLQEQAFAGISRLYERDLLPVSVSVGAWMARDFFDRSAPEQVYFWEVFFHIPYLVATRFLGIRRFAEARSWLHAIFDPTRSAGTRPERFWVTQPFRELLATRSDEVRALLPTSAADLLEQVDAMRREPFRPHAIAALRIAAYMRATFFRYLDVLIEWGDNLFRRETIESLNEATQLYVLARAMLGPQPDKVAARALPASQTFESLISDPDFDSALGNAEVEIGELVIPNLTSVAPPTPSLGSVALFCLPRNDKLDRYRNTVEDRLFKVRHCKTIEGSSLLLSLWDAPIDPGLLVRATDAGLDLQQILDDLKGPPLHFRFNVLVQKANELCGEVRSLGAALLAAFEKRDAEQLGRLRTHHEVELLGRVRAVKQAQIEEAGLTKAALEKSLALADARGDHYARLLRAAREQLPALGDAGGLDALASTVAAPAMTAGEGTVLLEQESKDFGSLDEAQRNQDLAANWELGASIAHPFTVSAGSPFFQMTANLGMALSAVAGRVRADAARNQAESTRLSKQASLVLRGYEWALQLKLAARERTQIEAQILAAVIRETIAVRELANHEQQVEESREVERFLRDKYTNEQLYSWTAGEITKLYFASYRLAQGMAQRAERAYRRELGKASSFFIRNDHWDSYYSGLLAGDRLAQDLKRLEAGYLDDCKRQFEITKHVSLAQLDPKELVRLRETGRCTLALTESLFDADYPDHELRRIKEVAVTIPAVTGPYSGVHCKLTLGRTTVRRGGGITIDAVGWPDAIVTSSGVNDGGLFEQNLRDERFLPFEGAGVVGDWTVELNQAQNSFDLRTVADFVLHLRYTAVPPAGAAHAVTSRPRHCLFDLRREFAAAWQRWKNDTDATAKLLVQIDRDRLPFTPGGAPIVESVGFYARASGTTAGDDIIVRFAGKQAKLTAVGEYGALLYNEGTDATLPAGDLGIEIGTQNGTVFHSIRADVHDLYLVCRYRPGAAP